MTHFVRTSPNRNPSDDFSFILNDVLIMVRAWNFLCT